MYAELANQVSAICLAPQGQSSVVQWEDKDIITQKRIINSVLHLPSLFYSYWDTHKAGFLTIDYVDRGLFTIFSNRKYDLFEIFCHCFRIICWSIAPYGDIKE